MAIRDLKFKESDFVNKDISSLPDNPSEEGFSASQLKARFDSVAKNMIALGSFNRLLELLESEGGGREIGVSDYKNKGISTVQNALEKIIDYIDEKIVALGTGDMARTVFVDDGGNGVVLSAKQAENATKLNNKAEGALSVLNASKLNNKAESALSVDNAAKLGGRAEADLYVKYATSAGSAVDSTARTTANNAVAKTAIANDILDASTSRVASAFLTNWLYNRQNETNANVNTKVSKSGDSISGNLGVSGAVIAGSYARLDYTSVSGIPGARLYSGSGGVIIHPVSEQVWNVGGFHPVSVSGAYSLGSGTYRWSTAYLISNPNVSCDSKGKMLIANVDFSGIKPKGWSLTSAIPIEDLRNLIRELEIREYYRYKSVIDEDAPPQIITFIGDDGKETTQELPVYKEVVDTENKELGIFIDDLKDNKHFDLFGRITKNEETGETNYSLDTGSYATLALAVGKDALNRLDALEAKHNALKQLLMAKGIISEEELQAL